ncbi:MAG: hypothetical protein WEB00_14355 [Dehalococcoidia bacterium]
MRRLAIAAARSLAPLLFAILLSLVAVETAAGGEPTPTPTAEETPTEDGGVEGGDAANNTELTVDTAITYDVQPAAEQVHVTVEALATNQNPESIRREFGSITYYRGYDLYLPASAENVVAESAGGAALEIEVSSLDEFFNQVAVFFDARFFFGETYRFVLQYDLPGQRESNLVISQNYLYFPAFADGTSSNVRIVTPASEGYEATVDNPDCAAADAGVFECAVVDPFTFLAFVEVVREGAIGTVEREVNLSERSVSLVIEFFEGEEAWANEIATLIEEALPALEEANGHPYAGPDTVTIREAARSETEGYAGRAQSGCQDDCVIQLLPVTSDFVALHEASHLWSNIFTERWLYEGFADWTAERAAAQLDVNADISTPALDSLDEPDGGLQLIQWMELECPPIRCPENRDLDLYGYAKSLEFIRTLEATVGVEALLETNRRIAESGEPVGAQDYMNTLEIVSGQNLDALFLEWVYMPDFEPVLRQRREARDLLTALNADLEGTDLTLPETIGELIDTWEFDQALELIPRASAVIPAYKEATVAVEEDRSLWTRIGLIGEDPDSDVDEASKAFGEGRFDDSEESSNNAIASLDDAESNGQQRGIIVGVLLGLVVVGVVVLLLLAGRRRVHHSPYH